MTNLFKSFKKWKPVQWLKVTGSAFLLSLGLGTMAASPAMAQQGYGYERNYERNDHRNYNRDRDRGCDTGDVIGRSILGAIIGGAIDDDNGASAGAALGAATCLNDNRRGGYYGDPYYRTPRQYQQPRLRIDPNYRPGVQRCFNRTVNRNPYTGGATVQRYCIDRYGRNVPVGPRRYVGR